MLILWKIINAVSILDKSRAIIIVTISIPILSEFTELLETQRTAQPAS